MSFIPDFNFSEVFLQPWSDPTLAVWNGKVVIMGILVSWTCGVIGSFIVVRKMALMGDAISHGILPGLVLVFIFSGSLSIGPMWAGACLAGLACSFCIEWLRANTPIREDAALGLVFTSFFALGITLMSLQGGHVDLDPACVLYGEIGLVPLSQDLKIGGLNLGNQALWSMGLVCIFILVCTLVFYRHLLVSSFDPTLALSLGFKVQRIHFGLMLGLALATVASLEAVGVILVVAMFVFPAVTASFFFDRLPSIVLTTFPLGLLYSIGGFHLAHWLDCSLAASMATFAAIIFVPCCCFGSKGGIISGFRKLNSNYGLNLPEHLETKKSPR